MTEGSFKGVEGIKIFTREWQPAGKGASPVELLGALTDAPACGRAARTRDVGNGGTAHPCS